MALMASMDFRTKIAEMDILVLMDTMALLPFIAFIALMALIAITANRI